ncbi:hypothetical protein VD0004_g9937 [Verticillium dahliae]|nr:hypothetical protein VD0004_g9937 [Verticillium dahliae]PNH59396.1 hypothetical protein VD0001_g9926 [Verticillium dahliae]
MAAESSNPDLCSYLVKCGAALTAVTSIKVHTPLLYATEKDMSELVHTLLLGGADSHQRGTLPDRQTPSTQLLLATEKRRAADFHRLIAAGARANDQDDEGFSPLHMAAASRWHSEHDTIVDEASKGDTDLLRSLIQKDNCDVNSPNPFNGSRPIHSAASGGTGDHVRILLDAGADVNARNNSGRTPLHWAAKRGS